MSNQTVLRAIVLASLVSLSACTGMQGPENTSTGTTTTETTVPPDTTGTNTTLTTGGDTTPPPVDSPVQPVEPAAPSANPAVIALLDNASTDATAGRLPTAIASVERALRIEPRNPALWQKLATLKLQKGEYQQAENFAARSNSWAGSNKAMQARNWHIISEARSLRGDNAGAKAALARAKALEQ